jgi:V/A-type H+/Na+-transporting ATPase subunit I
MFTPVPMQRVELSLLKDDAAAAALLLAHHGAFNPETSGFTAEQLPEQPGEVYRKAYDQGRAHLEKIFAHYELTPPDVDGSGKPVTLDALSALNDWLKEVWAQCSDQQEKMRNLRDDYRHNMQLFKTLEQFMDLNIDLTRLQRESGVMNIRVGLVPRGNIQRFEEAIGLAGHVAIRFFTGLEQVHLIVAGPTGQAAEAERVFQSAGWRTTEVPAEFHGKPAEVRASLAQGLARLAEQQAHEDAARRAAPDGNGLRQRLFDAAQTLACAAPYAELSGLMRARGGLATVSGWMPSDALPGLRRGLEDTLGARFALHARDPRPDERLSVPTLIRHRGWLRPFASLVLNYGVPRYGEFEPTVLFALTFVLMFGMMFGDAGQGVVIALGGLALRRRIGQYSTLAVAAGASSAVFGLLYGSVFGFEDVLPALWMPPLSDPLRMLKVALGWGIAFIAVATMLTIRNRVAEGRMRDALFDSHGAAGLALYAGLIGGGYSYATQGGSGLGALAALLVVGSLGAILSHTWRHNAAAPRWERALISLMEAFEAVMGYVSNTLSFLRLAAFSLNHVALTIAIFTVGSMMHATGYWASVVLGNIFILVLEGAIVAIQTLRLEYYEGFSRFFGGDGRAFQPLTVGGGKGLPLRM